MRCVKQTVYGPLLFLLVLTTLLIFDPVPLKTDSAYTQALSMQGLSENKDRGTLKEFFHRTLGEGIDPTKIPWCAAFMNALLSDSNIKGTGSLSAKSFLTWGEPTLNPVKGDIVVLDRGKGKGHVGFFVGYTFDGNISVLGGNQDNSVSIKEYSKVKVIQYRTK